MEILLADDEPSIRLPVSDAIRAAGHKVRIASDGAEAMALLDAQPFDLVITDIRMPKVDGRELLARVRRDFGDATDVVLITAYGAVADAVSALKEGAADYLTKPFEVEHLVHRIEAIGRERSMRRDLREARAALAAGAGDRRIIGRSPAIVRLNQLIDTFAPSEAAVLITGESGTGKELVAKTLHEKSPRAAKPFVAVNCAAFPETLIEAELFGHERGAFTGAVKRRDGRFKAASGGTLFLDEVAEIPLPTQAKLLRVLQEGAIEPLGTNQSIKVDVRILSATHRNLKEWIAAGRFREDLYYRLKVLELPIPPLRERTGDLALLTEHFLKRFAPDGKAPPISARAWAALQDYPFPGNVRELEHVLQHASVIARGQEIDLPHLPGELGGGGALEAAAPKAFKPLSEAAREFEREYLLRALHRTSGRKSEAADLLGISRKNLWEKLKAHGLQANEDET